MAKYTNDDTDVKYLDVHDNFAYNFELLKYDVDRNQEVRQGTQSITLLSNPELIGKMFQSPRDFSTAIIAISTLIAVILIVICIVIYIVLYIKGGSENEARKEVIGMIFMYFIGIALFLILMYWLFNT